MKVVFLFLLFAVSMNSVFAQNEGPFSIGFSAKTGSLMAHRQTMNHLVKDRNNVYELEFSRQDTGYNVWSHLFRYPSRGFAMAYQDYGNPEILGTSFSAFKFLKFPIVQNEKWGFVDFRLGTGISYITRKYDKLQNSKNVAIGSFINGYVNAQFAWRKQFGPLFLGGGIDFSHISNAYLKTPNLGLNSLTGFATVGFDIGNRKVCVLDKFVEDSLSTIRKFHKWQFHFIFGLKQNLPDHLKARNFGIASIQGLYRKKLSPMWDAEFGIDIIYNEANRWFYEINPTPVYEAFLAGGYAGMALSFYNMQIYFGIGAYGLNLINPAGWIYDRAGFRFNTNEKWNFSIGIKAHVGIADYLEWGLGYRL